MALILAAVAFGSATFGAISGLGGGIFMIPFLLQVFGAEYSHSSIASLSLCLVLLNALTALFFGRQIKNVDFDFAKPMVFVSAIGVGIGVLLQSLISRGSYELYLAGFLLLLAGYSWWRSPLADKSVKAVSGFRNLDFGFGILIGTVASFFGLGGGVLQVPYMVYMRRQKVKTATATSQIILATVAVLTITLLIVWQKVAVPWMAFVWMAPGIFMGGIFGSWLQTRLKGPWIVRILALVLFFLSLRLFLRAFQG